MKTDSTAPFPLLIFPNKITDWKRLSMGDLTIRANHVEGSKI
jgi:hypothetical protein